MRKFELLPHTSDVRLKVSSDSLQGLFLSALEGMNKIICPDFSRENSIVSREEEVDISSLDSSMLLIDFLSEVLTLSHKHKCIYSLQEIKEISEVNVKAVLGKTEFNGFDEDIKAVTYAEAKITLNDEGILETIIVFDI